MTWRLSCELVESRSSAGAASCSVGPEYDRFWPSTAAFLIGWRRQNSCLPSELGKNAAVLASFVISGPITGPFFLEFLLLVAVVVSIVGTGLGWSSGPFKLGCGSAKDATDCVFGGTFLTGFSFFIEEKAWCMVLKVCTRLDRGPFCSWVTSLGLSIPLNGREAFKCC